MALAPDQVAAILTVADQCGALLEIADPAERTREFVRVHGERLGLSPGDAESLAARFPDGVPAALRGGYHNNTVLPTAWADVVVRDRVAVPGGTGTPRWREPDALAVFGPQLAEIDAREAARSRAQGRPHLRVSIPELLYADAAERQIHRWFPGAKPVAATPAQAPGFNIEQAPALIPEVIARFAQLRERPQQAPNAIPYRGSANYAHDALAGMEDWLAANWDEFADVFGAFGMPRHLDRLHDLAARFHPRPAVVRHGDLGAHNILVDDSDPRDVEVMALDVELSTEGDWVHDVGWSQARLDGAKPAPGYPEYAAARLGLVHPDLAAGAAHDIRLACRIQEPVHAFGRLAAAVRSLRDQESGVDPAAEVERATRRCTRLLGNVRRSAGDGKPIDSATVRQTLTRLTRPGASAVVIAAMGWSRVEPPDLDRQPSLSDDRTAHAKTGSAAEAGRGLRQQKSL